MKIYEKEDHGEFFGILETVRDASYAIVPLFIGMTYKTMGLNGIFMVNAVIALLLLIFAPRALRRLT